MRPRSITFEDARAIAAAVLGPPRWAGPGTFMVADWGRGDDESWHVIAASREAIEDGDSAFVMLDDTVHLVDRISGELSRHHDLELRERLDAMTPVGEPPPDEE